MRGKNKGKRTREIRRTRDARGALSLVSSEIGACACFRPSNSFCFSAILGNPLTIKYKHIPHSGMFLSIENLIIETLVLGPSKFHNEKNTRR